MTHRRRLLATVALAALVALLQPQRSVAAGEPIELSAILSLTGPGAFLGTSEQNGLLVAADNVNKAGGIAGHPVHFTIQDDSSSAQVALTLANGLIARKVSVIFGPTLTASCSALAPLTHSGPLEYCMSAGMQPEHGSYVFVYQVSTADAIGVDVRYFREHGYKRIAMLTSTDATGQVGDQGIDAALALPENKELSLVDREHYNVNDLSVAAQISRIKNSGAQVMIAWGTGTPIGTVFRGIQDAGLDIPVTVSAGNDIYPEMKQFAGIIPRELISAAPPNIVMDSLPNGPVKDAVRQYIDAFKATGIRADISEASGWDPAQIIFGGLRKLGPNATAAQLKDYVSTLHDHAGSCGMYDFRTGDQRGLTASKNLVMVRWDVPKDTWIAISKFGGAPL
ncbi:MAG TPA: ABC transporter substrate-binding protein [Candidatus Lustribacter sp.]|nr:ABC transporter substrate-binding protein [Candidatus Lustribacter sp.]